MYPKDNYKNILIFNPAFLGDTVLTTPLINALSRLYPKAKITFCVRPEHAGLFIGLSNIHNVIVFDKRSGAKGLSGIIKFAKVINDEKFGLIINLHKSFRTSLLFMFVRGSYIIGFKQAVLSSTFNNSINRDMSLHEVERNLMTLSLITDGFTLEEAKTIGGKLCTKINYNLKDRVIKYQGTTTPDKKVIGIAPGSVWATKRYPAKYFAFIANSLYEQGFAIALFGSKSDEEELEEFKQNFNNPFYDYSYKTKVSELASYLAGTCLLIVNDSGLMHIAISADVPTVAIFGATTQSLGFYPYDDKSVVIENNLLTCRPCAKHGGVRCPKKHFKCMLDIKPNSVTNAALAILGANHE